jgi:hypothetical protein
MSDDVIERAVPILSRAAANISAELAGAGTGQRWPV